MDEVAKGKLTLAELDEDEQNLDRLCRWYRTIRSRDLFGAPSAGTADQRLKDCAEALESLGPAGAADPVRGRRPRTAGHGQAGQHRPVTLIRGPEINI